MTQVNPYSEKTKHTGGNQQKAVCFKILSIVPGAVFCVFIVLTILNGNNSDKLKPGQTIQIFNTVIPQSGGVIKITDHAQLNELTIHIPSGSYQEDNNITVSITEIKKHNLIYTN